MPASSRVRDTNSTDQQRGFDGAADHTRAATANLERALLAARCAHPTATFVRISYIGQSPHQVRGDYGDMEAFARQLAAEGLATPLLVRKAQDGLPGQYILVDGHRRKRAFEQLVARHRLADSRAGAASKLDDPSIPVTVVVLDDESAAFATLMANETQPLHAVERSRQVLVAAEAHQYGRRPRCEGDTRQYEVEHVAERIGRSRSTVSEQLLVARQITDRVLTEAAREAAGITDAGTVNPEPAFDQTLLRELSHQTLYEAALKIRTCDERSSGITDLAEAIRGIQDDTIARERRALAQSTARSTRRDLARCRLEEAQRYEEHVRLLIEQNLESARQGKAPHPFPDPPAWTRQGRRLAAERARDDAGKHREARLQEAYERAPREPLAIRSRKPIGRHDPDEASDALLRAAPQLLRLAERTPSTVTRISVPQAGEVIIVPVPARDANAHQVTAAFEEIGGTMLDYVRRATKLSLGEVRAGLEKSLETMLRELRNPRSTRSSRAKRASRATRATRGGKRRNA